MLHAIKKFNRKQKKRIQEFFWFLAEIVWNSDPNFRQELRRRNLLGKDGLYDGPATIDPDVDIDDIVSATCDLPSEFVSRCHNIPSSTTYASMSSFYTQMTPSTLLLFCFL